MFGFRKRLNVVHAFEEARGQLLGWGADVLKFVSEQSDQSFIVRPDIYRMRSNQFAGNWTVAAFLFADTLREKNCETLCSFAFDVQNQFSSAGAQLREFIQNVSPASVEQNRAIVTHIFEYTFNRRDGVGVREAIIASHVPVS